MTILFIDRLDTDNATSGTANGFYFFVMRFLRASNICSPGRTPDKERNQIIGGHVGSFAWFETVLGFPIGKMVC